LILIGIGANLPSDRFGMPIKTCKAAIDVLGSAEIQIIMVSQWYSTPPMPPSDQPRYVNGVIRVETKLNAEILLSRLHAIEAEFGRIRSAPNAARVLDLDLLDYDGSVTEEGAAARLPHPRLHERAFVLVPLSDVAPNWRHPVLKRDVSQLISALSDGDAVRQIAPEKDD
jgi:2-amino-4-hydroxy-6-hydroxymethyldihydropteridine diphosphokinase